MEFKLSDKIVFRRIGPNTVVVPIGQNVDEVRSIYTLNDSGRFVFEQIQQGKSTEQILDAIENEFDCDNRNEAKDWVNELVDDLRKHKILL